jgi:hypothetical protein
MPDLPELTTYKTVKIVQFPAPHDTDTLPGDAGQALTDNFKALADADDTLAAGLDALDAGNVSAGTLAVAHGGTGLAGYTTGDLLYASGSSALGQIHDVATGSVLVSGGVGAAPSWSSTPTVSGLTVSAAAGTLSFSGATSAGISTTTTATPLTISTHDATTGSAGAINIKSGLAAVGAGGNISITCGGGDTGGGSVTVKPGGGGGGAIKLQDSSGQNTVQINDTGLGFFNATPVAKASSTTDLRLALIGYGLYATGGASPLDLNGGSLTTGAAHLASESDVTTSDVTILSFGTDPASNMNGTPFRFVSRVSTYTIDIDRGLDGDYLSLAVAGLTGTQEFRTAQRIVSGVQTIGDGIHVSTYAPSGNLFRVTLGGNRTLDNPQNPTNGQVCRWEIIQDGTGSRTLTLGSKFALGTDISSVTLSTTAGKRDFLTAIYNSTADKWYVIDFKKGY